MGSAGILVLLLLVRTDARFRASLLQHFVVLDHFLEQVVQLFVADQAAPQIRQAVAQFQQFPKRRDLLSDSRGLKVVHAFESEFDVELSIVFTQAVRYLERQPRADFLHHVIDVVAVDGNELPLCDWRQRLLRHPGEIRQDTYNERKLTFYDGAARFYVVCDVHPGRPYPSDVLLQTFLCHTDLSPVRKRMFRSRSAPFNSLCEKRGKTVSIKAVN